MSDTSKRGFASMDPNRQRQIASKGGRAAHQQGKAHEFSTDEAREAGRRGGVSVSRDRNHMARIGRRGGQAVSRDRAHMAQIGRRGGQAVSRERSVPAGCEARGEPTQVQQPVTSYETGQVA